jgi:hypothetical protein
MKFLVNSYTNSQRPLRTQVPGGFPSVPGGFPSVPFSGISPGKHNEEAEKKRRKELKKAKKKAQLALEEDSSSSDLLILPNDNHYKNWSTRNFKMSERIQINNYYYSDILK